MPAEQNKFEKIFSEKPLYDVFIDINRYTKELLKGYLETIKNKKLTKDRKEIYDAVWKSIEFNSAELILIDPPLLQRLKQIRQLGMSDFVYPGSAYSRFYHTLGVTYLSSRMIKVLNQHIEKEYRDITDDVQRMFYQLVRYAAILHDVGHMLYSHASELFFVEDENAKLFEKTTEILRAFHKKTGYEPTLHELLSCMIVNSKAVKEMI